VIGNYLRDFKVLSKDRVGWCVFLTEKIALYQKSFRLVEADR